MDVEFILERMHKQVFLTTRAFRIIFSDTHLYCVHLGEDASVMPMGQAVGGLIGAVAQNIAESITEKTSAEKLAQLEERGLENMVASDKHSIKAAYTELEGISSDSMKWNRWPHLTFDVRGKGSFKYTFDLKMENLEEERQAVVEYLKTKRPGLVKS